MENYKKWKKLDFFAVYALLLGLVIPLIHKVINNYIEKYE